LDRLRAIANGAERIKAKSFTIDSEAVVLGPDDLSWFEELNRREATDTAILYAFDLIEHDARICAIVHSLTAGPCWHGCCAISSRTPAGLALRVSFQRRSIAPIDPVDVQSGSRSVIPPVSPCSGREVRFGIDEPRQRARFTSFQTL
jgi:hypothetical protein